MIEFKKLTEQLLKIYSNSKSVDDLNIENYFDENISLIGTGKHEIFENLNDFLESFQFDVKRRGQIKIEIRNLKQTEEWLNAEHVLAHGSVDFVGLFEDESICFKMNTRFTIVYKWTGEKWKKIFGLNSTNFYLENYNGKLRMVTVGKGHDMGMSLYGANALAKKQLSAAMILSYYYPGTKIVNFDFISTDKDSS